MKSQSGITALMGKTALVFLCQLVFNLWPFVTPSMAKAVEVPFTPKQILIFGGNGFMGARTSERLIEAGHSLTLVNRGNWYWDSAFTVKPYTRQIVCDRSQSVDKCSELRDFIQKSEGIDVVIDFSAYHPQYMEDSLSLLKGKVGLYIYISTDSVYEVCDKNHSRPTLETDAIRPFSEEEQEKRRAGESYGHYKLACEEVLAKHRSVGGGPPFVSLRLPDVVGPRDSTYRWWIYQMWIKLLPYLDKEVVILKRLADRPMSLVYVDDVAESIFKLAHHGARYTPPPSADGPIFDQAYNLALRETPTLLQLLEDIRDELNLTTPKPIKTEDKEDTIRLFPSVHAGPVDISKAEKLLGWNPTSYRTVVKETVAFYETAIKRPIFDDARKHMILTMQTYFTKKPYNVLRGLRDLYHLNYGHDRDEL